MKRSLWVQGYTELDYIYLNSVHAFPVGTGIYRKSKNLSIGGISVPCGYRDIPKLKLILQIHMKRSLWVQGYTIIKSFFYLFIIAFPVGTGIYRAKNRSVWLQVSVPCGYRDIPPLISGELISVPRSLWVQGYTDFKKEQKESIKAFPVGTGIYRKKYLTF